MCQHFNYHYTDVTMSPMASQITNLGIVYSTVYSDADERKHQSSASLAFVRRIHRGQVNSPHKRPVTRKMFPIDDVIMECINHLGDVSGYIRIHELNVWGQLTTLAQDKMSANFQTRFIKCVFFKWNALDSFSIGSDNDGKYHPCIWIPQCLLCDFEVHFE